ncbi:hypothetical protein ABGB16_06890 [Micromonospora sp. B11E3]|uniref:hypothetical protein n=1 Tax=Micromonospora sp. B11E3 TaxID=3153562 RepID=UPI00325D580E
MQRLVHHRHGGPGRLREPALLDGGLHVQADSGDEGGPVGYRAAAEFEEFAPFLRGERVELAGVAVGRHDVHARVEQALEETDEGGLVDLVTVERRHRDRDDVGERAARGAHVPDSNCSRARWAR